MLYLLSTAEENINSWNIFVFASVGYKKSSMRIWDWNVPKILKICIYFGFGIKKWYAATIWAKACYSSMHWGSYLSSLPGYTSYLLAQGITHLALLIYIPLYIHPSLKLSISPLSLSLSLSLSFALYCLKPHSLPLSLFLSLWNGLRILPPRTAAWN